MAIVKVIEVMGASNKSWEDAARIIVSEGGNTLKNIRSIDIENLSGRVENNRIVEYRVNGKVSFELQGH